MMRELRRAACLGLAFALWLCGIAAADGQKPTAEQPPEQKNTVAYAVRVVAPDNQVGDSNSYFDILVTPGQQQVLQAIVVNKGDEDIEVALEANTAFSNRNGMIEFSHTEQRDESMVVDFARIVTPNEPVIAVPAHGEAIAEFTLNVPDEPFEGAVYGGLVFTKLNQPKPKPSGGMIINNVYQYVTGMRIRESEQPAEPMFELTGADMEQNGNQSLVLNLRNPRPVIARNIQISVSLRPEAGGEPSTTIERSDIEMAPNTSMPLTILLDPDQQVEPGQYIAAVELVHKERTWQFEVPLTVQ